MLAFVQAIEKQHSITIDGYTSNKTEKGIIKDVAKAIEKFSKEESDFMKQVAKEYDPEYNTPFAPQIFDDSESYFFIYEKVPCASCWDEEKEEMKYKDGFCNYFCIRIIIKNNA